MEGVRFIRRGGRVIPIGTKGKASDWHHTPPKAVKTTAGSRAEVGARVGAKYGAFVGGITGATQGALAQGLPGAFVGGVGGALGTAVSWGLLGAAGMAAFGSRTVMRPGVSTYAPKGKKR